MFSKLSCKLTLDHRNHVIVTGYRYNGSNYDWYTISYDVEGNVNWSREHSYASYYDDYAYAVATDSAKNVIVGGISSYAGTNRGYIIKHREDGSIDWEKDLATLFSGVYGVTTDSEDNIIVVGYVYSAGYFNFRTVKYDADGEQLWVMHTAGIGYGVATDSQDNVIVTGKSFNGYQTIKYDVSGDVVWTKTYDGGSNDIAYGVAIDSQNDVIVTGTYDNDYLTVKYNGVDGSFMWAKTYDSGGVLADCARGVAVDSQDNVIVTGEAYFSGSGGWNYHTIKYATVGNEVWTRTYDSIGSYADYAKGIVIDSFDTIIVTGQSYNGSDYDYITIAYAQDLDYDGIYDYEDNCPSHPIQVKKTPVLHKEMV